MAQKWYYNSDSGKIGQWEEFTVWPALHAGLGWHGPFNSKQEAQTYYNTNKSKNPGWKAPTESTLAQVGNASGATDAVTGALGGGLSDDSIRSWLIRVGEILLGVVLVGVGVAKLTGATNVVAKAVKAKI
jgi:hypothetical protein